MSEKLIGTVTHYFGEPHVAVVQIEDGELHTGDQVHFYGHTSDFTERVTSMEVNHHKVEEAGPGDEVAIQVVERARPHDHVFLVE